MAEAESEFGGVQGMIAKIPRQKRDILPHQQLWEIYATDPDGDGQERLDEVVIERPIANG